jgi:hypothetical protein
VLKGIQLSLRIGDVVTMPAPQEVMEALTSVQVTSGSGARSGFQLQFTTGKRSIITTKLLPSGFFDPPRRVTITTTINGRSEVLSDGVITRHEINASNDPGQSTLTITGEDLTVLMDMVDFTGIKRYPAMPFEVRALICLAPYAAFGVIPKIIPSVIIAVENPLTRMPGHQGTDYEYLRYMAESVGYTFYVEPGPVAGTNTAYWGPEIKFGLPQAALTVNSDAHTNVDSMNFSFDGLSKKLFIFYVQTPATPPVSFPIPLPDITPLNPPLGPKVPFPLRTEFLNRPPDRRRRPPPPEDEDSEEGSARMPPTQAALIAMAKASRSADVITASGSLNVLRYGRVLKARQLVAVRGAGLTYDGFYYVKSVTHNLKRGEYKQSFSLTRNANLPYAETVPV